MKLVKQPFTREDVDILASETAYQGYFRLEKYRLKHRVFKGGWGAAIDRELFERGYAVGALPYDPKSDQVVLIEQFRLGALKDQRSPWLLECVAGVVDKAHESIEDTIHREADEEAGLDISALWPIYDYWVSPGGTSERIHLFCAKVDASQASGIHGLNEEGEDIRVHVIDREQAYAALATGEIDNALTIIALQWLQLNYTKVKEQWLL